LHGLTKCCYFRYDRLSNMTARGHKSLWLAEIFNDLLLQYYLKCCYFLNRLKIPRWPPAGDIIYGKYVKQTSQEPLDGLEPYLAEMFLTRFWSIVVTFCSDRLSNMAARGHNSLWLAEISKDLLLRYYMEDGIENCHERSLQAANQVLLLFGLIENPRWPPARDIS
jgi:hypothetical protein